MLRRSVPVVAAFLFLASSAVATAPQVPDELVSTGRLLDANDRPLSGMQTLTFGLFAASVQPQTPDEPVWSETYQVQCDASGLYRVVLGGSTDDSGATGKKPLDPSVFAENPQLYLQVKVGAVTLSPRIAIGSVPFAMFASVAGDADTLGGHSPDYFATAASDASKLAAVTAQAPLAVDTTDPTHPALSMAQASATADGYLAQGDFATFEAKLSDVTAQAPLAVDASQPTHPVLSMAQVSATADGFLAHGDFARFDAKQDALSMSPPLTLDASGHVGLNTGSTLSLDANGALGVTPGTYIENGTSTQHASFAIDGNGAVGTLTTTGAVGIGTPSPMEELDVAGNVRAASFYIRKMTLPVDGKWYKVAEVGGEWGRIAYMYDNPSGNNPVLSSGEIMVINDNFALRMHSFASQYGQNNNLQFARSGNAAESGVIWVKAAGTSSGTFYVTENQNCTLDLDGTNVDTPPAGPGQVIYPRLAGNTETYSSTNLAVDGNIAAGGDVSAYGETLTNTVNVQYSFTKASANGVCPSGSLAVYTPWAYRGQTGDQICGATRSHKTCAAVKYVYGTIAGNFGTYPQGDITCPAAVNDPWPWGSYDTRPDTLDSEWGHPDLYVVCCQ